MLVGGLPQSSSAKMILNNSIRYILLLLEHELHNSCERSESSTEGEKLSVALASAVNSAKISKKRLMML